MKELAGSVFDARDRIYFVRGTRVMLDRDLAHFYGIETRILKRSVKSNLVRFPTDFMFELTKTEYEVLRSKFDTSNSQENLKNNADSPESSDFLRSKFRISKTEMRGGDRYLPYAFSELGISMLSSVLNTDRAIQVNITLMRAFFHLRHFAENPTEIVSRINNLSSKFEEFSNQVKLNFKQQSEIIAHLSSAYRSSEKSVLLSPSRKIPIDQNVQEILQTVSDHFGITIQDLRKPVREQPIVLARQIAIFLMREKITLSLKAIGSHFFEMDHTTVLYAYRKIRNDLRTNEKIQKIIACIQDALG